MCNRNGKGDVAGRQDSVFGSNRKLKEEQERASGLPRIQWLRTERVHLQQEKRSISVKTRVSSTPRLREKDVKPDSL